MNTDASSGSRVPPSFDISQLKLYAPQLKVVSIETRSESEYHDLKLLTP